MKKNIGIFISMLSLIITTQSCKHESGTLTVKPIDTSSNFNGSTNKIDSICYEEWVQPILISGCAKSGCHDDVTKREGINFSSYESMKATISGDLILQSIRETGELKMPPNPYPSLSTEQVNIIQQWVNEGMQKGIDCEGVCDTTNITYSKGIQPIIQNNCLGCHTSGTNEMTSYSKVKTIVDSGKFTCSINRNNGCLPMPPVGPKLSPCKLLQIKKWMDSGAPNN